MFKYGIFGFLYVYQVVTSLAAIGCFAIFTKIKACVTIFYHFFFTR